eukprot:3856845-Prymnesium_polylepis.1
MAATKATPGVPADPAFFGDRVGSARVCGRVSFAACVPRAPPSWCVVLQPGRSSRCVSRT